MISKGKRRYIQDLYRPDMEFFIRDGKQCLKLGDKILVDVVPTSLSNPNAVKVNADSLTFDIDWTSVSNDPQLFEPGTLNLQPQTPINEPYRPKHFFKEWGHSVFPPKGI